MGSKIDALEQELLDIKTELEISKLKLELKNEEIQKLKGLLNENYSTMAWAVDQLSYNRMGL